jgi:hypothetical protein
MIRTCSKVPIQSVSNDRRVGVLPAAQSNAACGIISALAQPSCVRHMRSKRQHMLTDWSALRAPDRFDFFTQPVPRPGGDSSVHIMLIGIEAE